MKPTKAQIKEFWERCGKSTYWTYEKGWNNYPPIDLNNLFKYAVPLAIKRLAKLFKVDLITARRILFDMWLNHIVTKTPKEDLALFWSIWEVIHDRKE